MYDVCVYNRTWRNYYCYNLLSSTWPRKVIWMNPPFTSGKLCLDKAILEFYEGANVVVLLPWDTVRQNALLKKYFAQIVTVKFLPPTTFLNESGELRR